VERGTTLRERMPTKSNPVSEKPIYQKFSFPRRPLLGKLVDTDIEKGPALLHSGPASS
jgi:hypothetical protein